MSAANAKTKVLGHTNVWAQTHRFSLKVTYSVILMWTLSNESKLGLGGCFEQGKITSGSYWATSLFCILWLYILPYWFKSEKTQCGGEGAEWKIISLKKSDRQCVVRNNCTVNSPNSSAQKTKSTKGPCWKAMQSFTIICLWMTHWSQYRWFQQSGHWCTCYVHGHIHKKQSSKWKRHLVKTCVICEYISISQNNCLQNLSSATEMFGAALMIGT